MSALALPFALPWGVVLVLVAVDDEDAINDTSAAVEDLVLASLPSMVRGT
jgi:hypothetical protein